MMTKVKTIKLYCGQCKRETNHNMLFRKSLASNSDDEYIWSEDHYLCQCAGCDSVCYAIADWNQDYGINDDEEANYKWKTYPSGRDNRYAIDKHFVLPRKVRKIYTEVIGAMNADLPILAAIGLRALIESVGKDRKIKGRNLENLIDGLSDNGILSLEQATILHGHRFMGNVAAHEIQQADRRELVAALEIAENMVSTIYILPKLSKEIVTGKPKK